MWITDEHMTTIEDLCDELRSNAPKEVCLLGQDLTEFELVSLSSGIRGKEAIKTLKLEECRFAAQGFAVLLKRLSLDKTLKHLSLSGSHLKDNDFRALLSFIKEANFLSLLDLSGLRLNDVQGVELCKALTSNHAIKHLTLECNAFSTKTAHALIKWLPNALGLKHLNLSSNHINEADLLAIIDTLNANRSVLTLNLSFNCNQHYSPSASSKFERQIAALINEKIEANRVKTFIEHLQLQTVNDEDLSFWATKVYIGGKQCRSYKVPHTIANLINACHQPETIFDKMSPTKTIAKALTTPSSSHSSLFGQSGKYRSQLVQRLRKGEFTKGFDEIELEPQTRCQLPNTKK